MKPFGPQDAQAVCCAGAGHGFPKLLAISVTTLGCPLPGEMLPLEICAHSQLIPVALQHPQSSGKGLQVQELLSGLCWLSAVGFGAVIPCWELCLHHQPCSFAFSACTPAAS